MLPPDVIFLLALALVLPNPFIGFLIALAGVMFGYASKGLPT
ncbi:MAG: hypothetical protein R3E39_22530 [Anaerolineae bacterium]